MPANGEAGHPADDPKLIIVPDALIPGEDADDGDANGSANGSRYALHPALHFVQARLQRAARAWAEAQAMAPIEWYAALIGVREGASALLAAAMGDAIPADARQCWLFSPFAGRLGRDRVHIMPESMFAWDHTDAEWLAATLAPLLAEDGFTLLVRDACLLAVSSDTRDARPASFARVAGHVLPNRHPEGADGGRLMRLCAEMQMLLASNPSQRRRDAGLPEVMGVWLWAPSSLPMPALPRPRLMADDALIRACTDDGGPMLPVAIVDAAGVEAYLEHRRSPRHWLLAGDGHAALADMRALPRFGRKAWQAQHAMASRELAGRLHRLVGRAAA